MKVSELITRLREFDPDLTVALADWNEDYANASIEAADRISVQVVGTWDEASLSVVKMTCVMLGDEVPDE